MNPNPNYLVPREAIDYKTSYELIEELTAYYIKEIAKQPSNSHLEIEAKMGYIIRGRDPSFDSFINMFYSLSDRDFIIMGLRSPMANILQYFGGNDLVSGNYRLDREKISKKRFIDIKNYFEKEGLDYPDKIKESKNQFDVDFQMPDGSRVTYDLHNNKWSRIRKGNKSNIDILHKSFPYRISFAFEEDLEFHEEEFDINSVKNIRIKDRKCYEFQYMEYSLTEVVDLNTNDQIEKSIAFTQIKMNFLKSKKKFEDIMDLFVALKLKLLEENEIEVEVIDLKPFIDTRGKIEFGSYLKRFIRNSEALFHIPKFFNSSIAKELFHTEKRITPAVGQYLSELYMEQGRTEKTKTGNK